MASNGTTQSSETAHQRETRRAQFAETVNRPRYTDAQRENIRKISRGS